MRPWTWRSISFGVGGAVIGAAIVGVVVYFAGGSSSVINPCSNQYPLVNNLISCMSLANSTDRLHAVDTAVDAAVAQYISEGRATDISVWTRDLKTSQWASTNENETYDPASLLKVPLLIAYLKVSEVEPSILESQLTYTTSGTINDSTQDIKPQAALVSGQSYTVEELMDDMIVNSDNNATNVLLTHLDPTVFNQTLTDLGLRIPINNGAADFVTAKTYSNIFRMLYNASYLNLSDSEKALNLLSSTTFNGIRQPLPKDVVVADKFGEREVDNPDGSVASRELHDCGIVYKSPRPYVLCVMTKGKDFNQLLGVIQDISSIVYQQI